MKKILNVDNLSYKVQNKEILKGIDLAVEEGDIFALLGINGSGKSTLIDNILKDIAPSSGEISYHEDLGSNFQNVGVVYDKLPLFLMFTVEETIRYFCAIYKTSFKEAEKKYFRLFQLDKLRKSLIRELSHGEKKRVCLLLAVLTPKELLILDEPFANLDPPMIDLMWKTLRQESKTIFFSTHHWKEVQSLATKVAFIHEGKIIGTVDSPSNILSHFDNKKVVINKGALNKELEIELESTDHYILEDEIHILKSPENGGMELVKTLGMNYSIQDVSIIDAYLFEGNKKR
ncbi:MAG: ABC transporter ATP-binding protein [Prolixibacteraceae bacterium]|jgi:ABC-2 type transport system ATP-binding protein|nr:ABC transporter ATP-binding protein [Prolixibacteraceae bacterium]